MPFAKAEELITAIGAGEIVILVDDEDRENEGDFVMAADKATPERLQFMIRKGGGLVCCPVDGRVADRLKLPMMGPADDDKESLLSCAFTISVDAREGTTTGISAYDRVRTLEVLVNPRSKPSELRRPGHMFPIRAVEGGVLERQGHTEAAVDLARLAGSAPVGVICEVLNDDGTMARLPDLERLAEREGLLLGRIIDLVEYRREFDQATPAKLPQANLLSEAKLPTRYGVFDIQVYEGVAGDEIVALVLRDETRGLGERPLVRVHSACFTGDILGSLRCDCGGQLELALHRIGEAGRGVLLYLPQEGRGIGLPKKIEAYRLQEEGQDTVEANESLGFPADLRSYDEAARILRSLGLAQIRLLTNNPKKVEGLAEHGIQVQERLPLETGPGPVNHTYLKTKKDRLGHLFKAV